MIQNARGTVKADHKGHDQEADGDDGEGFAPRQTDGDDAAGELPGCRVEGVGDPVGNEACYAPFALVGGNGVEVCVCPSRVSLCEGGFRLVNSEPQHGGTAAIRA